MPTNVRYWKHMKILALIRDRADIGRSTPTTVVREMTRDIYPKREGMGKALLKLYGMGAITFRYEVQWPADRYAPDELHAGDWRCPHCGEVRVWSITDAGRHLLEKVEHGAA